MKSLLSFFVAVLVLCACDTQKREEESPIDKAYTLIDQQRTTDAIQLLEGELAKDPGNQEYKIVLASAYAHKSGIRIQKLIPMVLQAEKLQFLQSNSENAGSSAPGSESGQNFDREKHQVNQAALHFAAALSQVSVIAQVFVSIPVIKNDAVEDLKYAIHLLSDPLLRLKSEDLLYRAILRVVYLKHVFHQDIASHFVGEAPQIQESKCQVDVGQMKQSLAGLGQVTLDLIQDLALALPKKSEKLRSLDDQIKRKLQILNRSATHEIDSDPMSRGLLTQLSLQLGFLQLLRCE